MWERRHVPKIRCVYRVITVLIVIITHPFLVHVLSPSLLQVKPVLLTLPEHMTSPPVFCGLVLLDL